MLDGAVRLDVGTDVETDVGLDVGTDVGRNEAIGVGRLLGMREGRRLGDLLVMTALVWRTLERNISKNTSTRIMTSTAIL